MKMSENFTVSWIAYWDCSVKILTSLLLYIARNNLILTLE